MRAQAVPAEPATTVLAGGWRNLRSSGIQDHGPPIMSFHSLHFRVRAISALALLALCTASAMSRAATPILRQARLATGVTLAWQEHGDAGAPAVLLLHGFTDTARSFAPVVEALRRGGRPLRVLVPDLRGHGDSSLPAGCAAAPERCFTPAVMASDVLALMDLLGIGNAHVVGHSMGSVVAQELALAAPARVTSMVLIGSFVDGTSSAVLHQFLKPRIEGTWQSAFHARHPSLRWPDHVYTWRPVQADPDAEAWMAQQWVVEPLAPDAFTRAILPETAATPLGTWIGVSRALSALDNRARLAALTVPTLVLWATQDTAMTADDQDALREALEAAVEDCRTRVVYKSYGRLPLPDDGVQGAEIGHNTHWAAPEAVAADLHAWWSGGWPTPDLPHGSEGAVVVAPNAASVVERVRQDGCGFGRESLSHRGGAGAGFSAG